MLAFIKFIILSIILGQVKSTALGFGETNQPKETIQSSEPNEPFSLQFSDNENGKTVSDSNENEPFSFPHEDLDEETTEGGLVDDGDDITFPHENTDGGDTDNVIGTSCEGNDESSIQALNEEIDNLKMKLTGLDTKYTNQSKEIANIKEQTLCECNPVVFRMTLPYFNLAAIILAVLWINGKYIAIGLCRKKNKPENEDKASEEIKLNQLNGQV